MIDPKYIGWVQSVLFNFIEVFSNWQPKNNLEAKAIAGLVQGWMEDPQIQSWTKDLFILTLEALIIQKKEDQIE